MKVILDNIIFSLQRSGGISTVWYELIKNIQIDNRFDVFFLEYKGADKNILRKNLNLPSDKILNAKVGNSVFVERYKSLQLDITEPFIFVSSYYRICSNKNALNVSIVHDFIYEYYRKGIPKIVHSLQKKFALNKSDLIICISENTKKDLLKFYPKIHSKDIRVIYNGVSNIYKKLQIDKGYEVLDPNLEFLNTKNNILFVGSRASYKNFDKVVNVIASLDNTYHLLIVGEPLSEVEKSDIDSKLSTNRYTVLSRVSNEDLNYIYNLSYALLYPSAYEGFGIPLLEAMKCGLPIIAYNNSSIPEVVGDAGILVDHLDSQTIIESLTRLEDIDFRKKLIEKGYKQNSKFSWDKTIASYLESFKNLYNGKY